MTSLEIKRTSNTAISVKTQTSGNRVTVDHFLWFAREVEMAVRAGMPTNTEVIIRNETGVNGVTISARTNLTQDIP